MYPKQIKLSEMELKVGCITGYERHIESVINKRRPRFPERYVGELLLNHQMAACAELAFCKMSGIYFAHTKNTFHVADVLNNIEVRFSNLPEVKVRADDDDMVVVSMSGNLDGFVCNGWIKSEDAKLPEYEKDYGNRGRPAFFVPLNNIRKDSIRAALSTTN
jgi:hypothetical protein